MKVAGIICEYNPFHYGHLHHIQETKKITQCDVLICVMSGNFVQRGEPAIVDKWERTKAALAHGADIVIELPFAYATQSATQFAQGAMHLLKLAKADCFCFGSETNDLETLKEMSKLPFYTLNKTISMAKEFETAFGVLASNDILGINYLKYCDNLKPYCIKRSNDYLSKEITGKISSATSIREAIKDKKEYQETTPMNLEKPHFLSDYYPYIQTLLLTLPKDYLSTLFMMDEGIENQFIKQARYDSFEDFMNQCISRRYTRSRIQRTLVHLLNQTTKENINDLPLPNYLRILGFNETGRAYLKTLEKGIVASRFNQIPSPFREMELKATQVYASTLNEQEKKEAKQKELQPPILW